MLAFEDGSIAQIYRLLKCESQFRCLFRLCTFRLGSEPSTPCRLCHAWFIYVSCLNYVQLGWLYHSFLKLIKGKFTRRVSEFGWYHQSSYSDVSNLSKEATVFTKLQPLASSTWTKLRQGKRRVFGGQILVRSVPECDHFACIIHKILTDFPAHLVPLHMKLGWQWLCWIVRRHRKI